MTSVIICTIRRAPAHLVPVVLCGCSLWSCHFSSSVAKKREFAHSEAPVLRGFVIPPSPRWLGSCCQSWALRLPMTPSMPLVSTGRPTSTRDHPYAWEGLPSAALCPAGPGSLELRRRDALRCPNPLIMTLCTPCGHGQWQRSDGVVGRRICALQEDLPCARAGLGWSRRAQADRCSVARCQDLLHTFVLPSMKINPSDSEQSLRQQVEQESDSVRLAHDVHVVHECADVFVRCECVCHFFHSSLDSDGGEQRHQEVALLSPLSLRTKSNLIVLRGTSSRKEQGPERETSPPTDQTLMLSTRVDFQEASRGVPVCCRPQRVSHAVGPCSGRQCVLELRTLVLKLFRELSSKSPRDQSSGRALRGDASHPTVPLAESSQPCAHQKI